VARVLLFGGLADQAGWRDGVVEAQTWSGLFHALTFNNPLLAEALRRPGVEVAIDRVIVRGEASRTTGVEVAFLPPMSGG
jgi:molybdopterin synthase sulfur carrier subunit